MKQIIQYQKNGELRVAEVPMPVNRKGCIIVRNAFSLVSTGTEKTSVETAEASLIGKARTRPDLVKQVLDNVKKEGITATYEKVQSRLDNYKELGYSCAGVVTESDSDDFKAGDRVACGGNYANHAEYVCVPKNLAVKIPDCIGFDEAAFATIGAIAMQGIRQADLRIGENTAVIGLGLIGLLTVRMLKASGCRIAGLDIDDSNFAVAEESGCGLCCIADDSSVKKIEEFTSGYGTDAVIITAGTKSNLPVELAVKFARKKSRIVVVGAVGMNVPRAQFYEKELGFTISCSYGAGRYDSVYEEQGIDYPIGYVRWTENRNMRSVLQLIADGKLKVSDLISHRIPVGEGLKAYDIITGKKNEKHNAILIEYPKSGEYKPVRKKVLSEPKTPARADEPVIGFIGAGNFAQSYLLPELTAVKARLKGVCTASPVNSDSAGRKFGFEFCTTNPYEIFTDSGINTVFIATRHDSHGKFVLFSLNAGKNVFTEKPLCINPDELEEIRNSLNESPAPPLLMTGFNRRFSAPVKDIKKFFGKTGSPLVVSYRVNAGFIPNSHWIQSPEQGGRIVGEVCHFIDTISFLTGAEPVKVFAESVDSDNSASRDSDNVCITLKYSDGSAANIVYVCNGDSALPKEYLEVSSGGRTAVMNNFKDVLFYNKGKKSRKTYDGSKGHKEEILHFLKTVKGKEEIAVSPDSIFRTTEATFKILESLRSGVPKEI